MKALILAAGYATRLRPLTENRAKPLLPVAGRPMVDWTLDKISEVPDVDEMHLVTNDRFAGDFAKWADGRVRVHNDGTTSNEDRMGAIGDIVFVADEQEWEGEDVLVVAGDNLFDFSLAEYVAWWRAKDGSAIAVYEQPNPELVSQYSVVELDTDDRVLSFVEKPERPESNLTAIATYVYNRAHLALLRAYLADGNSPDQPGHFIAWLHTRAPVYGYRFGGEWLDIGDRSQLLEADNRYRRRAGLPERDQYSVE
ncbi:MAG: nucleotidyltransferase family protein [Gaiellaceae bacterium]